MKYWSDVLNDKFNTPEELTAAEEAHEAKVAEKKRLAAEAKAKQEALLAEKSKRKKEVDEAYKLAGELAEKYASDYGEYRIVTSYPNLFNALFNW